MVASLVGRPLRAGVRIVGRGFSSGVGTLVIALFCVVSTIHAQQPEPPRAGTNGVSVPALQTFVAPVYPAVALLEHPTWAVKADVLVRTDGVVENVHVIDPRAQSDSGRAGRKPPDADEDEVSRSVVDAVRQWVFVPPMVNGAPATVVVPMTVRFEVFSPPNASFFAERLPVAEMPSDFSMVYTQGLCTFDTHTGIFSVEQIGDAPAASRRLVLRGDELDSIYQEMRRVRLFDYPTAIRASYVRGSSSQQRDATWVTSTDGVLVVIRLENSGPMVREPSALHRFEVRQNGKTSSVTWDDGYNGPAITREIEGIRAVINVVNRVLERHQELRDLQAVAQGCRALP